MIAAVNPENAADCALLTSSAAAFSRRFSITACRRGENPASFTFSNARSTP
jgi:hypothetical protein